MLGRLLKRQIQPSMVYTSSGYIDSLGRVGRFFEGNWAGAYVDQNTALGIPAIYRGITLISDAIGATGPAGTSGTSGTSFTWEGDWDINLGYYVNDVVQYNGSSYICIQNVPSLDPPPPSNPTIWATMSQAGAIGATGATGSGSTYTYITEDTVNKTLQLAITGSTIFDEIILDPDQVGGNTRIKSTNVADVTEYSEFISTYDNPSWSVFTSTDNSSITLAASSVISGVGDGTNTTSHEVNAAAVTITSTDGVDTSIQTITPTTAEITSTNAIYLFSEFETQIQSLSPVNVDEYSFLATRPSFLQLKSTNSSGSATYSETFYNSDGTIVTTSTDGTNTSTQTITPAYVSTTSTDGINTHEVSVEPAYLTLLGSDVRVDNLSANDGDFVAIGINGRLVATASPLKGVLSQGSFGITIDGGGSAITTGVKGYVEIPYDGTITGWTILGDVSGSCVIDVWKDTYANFPPTVADTIAGSEKPTLSSAIKNEDLTLTTWTTSVTAGDIIGFNVDSASTVTRVTLSIKITKL